MIKLLGRIQKSVIIAVSGGADSMICLDFIRGASLPDEVRDKKGRRVLVLHFDHGTDHGAEARSFVESFCLRKGIPCLVGEVSREIEKGESKEAFWREQRYSFFDNWHNKAVWHAHKVRVVVPFNFSDFIGKKIITCHHLDDQVENWIFSSLHGSPRRIPYKRGDYIRPFLLSTKSDLLNFRNRLPPSRRMDCNWIHAPSNKNVSYMRNFIRHELMPNALTVNPGLSKVVKKKIIAEYEESLDILSY